MVELRPPVPYVAKWGYRNSEGVAVHINNFSGAMDPPETDGGALKFIAPRTLSAEPTRILLHAEVETSVTEVPGAQLDIPEQPRKLAERAISEMANILGILSQSTWNMFSPRPYILLSGDDEREVRLLRDTKRIILPPARTGGGIVGPGLRAPFDVAGLLHDRPDGVVLLGAAVAAGHGVGKLHELFRLFENAFSTAGVALVEPLAAFLQSYPSWRLEYNGDEIGMWVRDLRHPATHADLQKTTKLAMDSDIDPYMPRIEQAAYDVLFNKESWNSCSPGRLQRWNLTTAQLPDGGVIWADEAVLRTTDNWDHFHAFRLDESCRLHCADLPEGWMSADWYFSESDWEAFGRE
jgi:hypothetical protein